MIRLCTLLTGILLAFCPAESVLAAPPLVHYQGHLTDSETGAVNGQQSLEVRLWNHPTESAPVNLVYGPQVIPNVHVENGQFHIVLGPEDAQNRPLGDVFADEDVYIGIVVGGAQELPRQRILSTPYALHAENGPPVGSVQQYLGLGDPKGWLACDGRVIDKTANPEYRHLVEHLRAISAEEGPDFRDPSDVEAENRAVLPDLRGLFLRGLNDFGTSAGPVHDELRKDPEGDDRKLGDIQQDEIKSHNHTYSLHSYWGDQPAGVGLSHDNLIANFYTFDTNYTGGTESRPKNLSIVYIIKY